MTDNKLIYEELIDLEKYVNNNVTNCHLGLRDNSADDYPIIELLTQSFKNYDISKKTSFPVINIDCAIIVAKENEIKAWEVYDKFVEKIKQFNFHRGHKLLQDVEIVREIDFRIVSKLELRVTCQDESTT